MGVTGLAGRSLNLFGNNAEARREEEELRRQAEEQRILMEKELDLREDRLRTDYQRTTQQIKRQAMQAQGTLRATAGARGVRGNGSVGVQRTRLSGLTRESLNEARKDLQLGLEQIDIARLGGQYDIARLERGADEVDANRKWQLGADITDFVGDFVGAVGRGLNMGVS
jgi:hypothetical protein